MEIESRIKLENLPENIKEVKDILPTLFDRLTSKHSEKPISFTLSMTFGKLKTTEREEIKL